MEWRRVAGLLKLALLQREQWPGLAELSAYIVTASVFTGLLYNVGFFLAISWDLVGVLDVSDFISSAVSAGFLVLGGLLGVTWLLFVAVSISRAWSESVRETLDRIHAAQPEDKLNQLLMRVFDFLDRLSNDPMKALSRSVTVGGAIGYSLLALLIVGLCVRSVFGFSSPAQAWLGFASIVTITVAVHFVDEIFKLDRRIRWIAVFAAVAAFTALVAASHGAKKADEVWESGSNFVELRSAPTGTRYRVLESFGRGVLAKDGAGNALFVPWSNVEKLTVTAPRR